MLEKDCDDLVERLNDYQVMPAEAQELSQKYLFMAYRINKKLRELNGDIVLLTGLAEANYSKAFASQDGKSNVSKAKADATANPDFAKAQKALKKTEAEKEYWKNNYEIMNNAHIFYKVLLKE